MHAFADMVRQPAYGQNVAATVKGESILFVQALASQNVGVNQL
jgi:hypothetical protein